MGNAGTKEGENGSNGPSVRSDGDPGFPPGSDHAGRVRSVDLMGSSPPESPGLSRSPLVFVPQVPIAPLQGAADVSPVYDQLWMNDDHGPSDAPIEKGIPTLITWSYGGNDVAVEGSWDNWTSRKALQRTGKDHSILFILPTGVYHYKFIVDENLDSVSEFECPPSPDSSYGQSFPVDEDFAKEPPAVPPQLHVTVLGMHNSEEAPKKPQHVVLNHLFIEKGWASESLVALGLTHRFQSKYVTVVLYKPLRKQ